ncbi:alpha-hydroxy-acid oxidizing protein [Lederbergia citrea]|uniref:alpha-hydroxy-acid oxidizing protein n=1 Tax=Lederbergia citrea TaxID=2833581 RepID=UPI001BC97F2D|nr:alpha-hydroxy-acid oxidizing protein [Lederbergia citrea]MBS4177705.1 alpha-hydroxy-acid oxidizing protein [Lederbergia citrea]MBS4204382.1 alpha-hydroxy-acid oxidizing protein [Lederbergia citrea]
MGYYESVDSGATLLPVSFTEWEKRAKEKLAAGPFGYVYGAAGAGDTMKANEEAFRQYRIRPRVCQDISKRDLEISLFGKKYPVPFLFAPIGVNSIVHSDAEVAPAKAAASLGIPYTLSNVSTTPMEKIAEVMGDSPRWFQLYPPINKELTKSFLKRAEEAGFSAIVVTIDSTLLGWRETDLRNAFLPFLTGQGMGNYFTDPVFLSMLDEPPENNLKAACKKALDEGNNVSFSWKDLEFIKKETNLPVLLKGLTHPADALLAIEHGVDGIIVSNHGGRQLDGAIGTLEALPSVCEAVEHKVPVLMDSGIRRGADIIKALALGASAVLIGRPYIYGLTVAGETGVKSVAENFIAETELQMAICGKKSISEIDQSLVIKI